jgi:hypothetical protein
MMMVMVMMVMVMIVVMITIRKGKQRVYLHYGIVTFEAVDAVVDVVGPLRETIVSESCHTGDDGQHGCYNGVKVV